VSDSFTAVFGNKVSWKEDTFKPSGHELTFKEALHHSSENLLTKAALPGWALGLTSQLRLARLAFKELGVSGAFRVYEVRKRRTDRGV
jgi:hypothetical protein